MHSDRRHARRGRAARLVRLAVLPLALAAAGCGRSGSGERAAAAWPAFEQATAWDDLQNLVGFGARSHGTPGHRHAMNYLVARLRANGLSPAIVSFTNRTSAGAFVFHNIEAVLPGDERHSILLTTHYDARAADTPEFPSANSSASGPAVLLEIGRVLAAAHRGDGPSVRLVFFDGMEPMARHGFTDGLQGSKHLARRLGESDQLKDIAAMVNLDMVGDRNLTITLPRNVSKPLRKRLLDAAHAEEARSHFRLVPFDIGDDHDPFHERGVPAVNLIDYEYGSAPGRNDYWRTPEDTIDKLSPDSLGIVGRVTLRLVRDLLDNPGFSSP